MDESDSPRPVPPVTGALMFFDLAGLPGWGSEAAPNDPDTSTMLERYLGGVAGDIRVVQGCTVLAVATDVRRGVHAAMDVLGEAARSSGSAVAGLHVTSAALDDIGPSSHDARVSAALAELAEADRLLVTADAVAALGSQKSSTLMFDVGPAADLDGERFATFSVRRR